MKNEKQISHEMETLKQKFPQCFDDNGIFDVNQFKTQLTNCNIEFSDERYELNWIGKSYSRKLVDTKTTTLYKEDDIHNQKPKNSTSENLLIKGDNLEVLKHLRKAYHEKIKLIYIDPPYNTKNNHFVYSDYRKYTVDDIQKMANVSKSHAKRILALTNSKINSHSAWLSFMYPRLLLARDLLTKDGVIFISIDDNEQANLKLLCDDVFGEENFVAKFDWRKKTGANDANDIAIITESILLFAKNKNDSIKNDIWSKDESSINKNRYRLSDEFISERGKFYFDTLDRGGLTYSDSMNFGIKAPDGGIIFPNGRSEFKNDGWIWKWSKEKVKWGIENKFLEFVESNKSKGSKYTIKYKVYKKVDNEGKIRKKSGRAYLNLIVEPINQQGSEDFSNLFSDNVYFSNPKPVNLIKYFLNIIDDSSIRVLDFFAGSGTTGHAVMQLNAEDGGNRKFILVQLPELIDKKKSKAAYDFVKNELNVETPTIFDITKERLLRAAKKIQTDNHNLFSSVNNQDFGFKIYETIPFREDVGSNTKKDNY